MMAKVRISTRIMLKLSSGGESWGQRIEQALKQWAAAGMSEDNIVARLEDEVSPGGRMFESIMKSFRNSTGEVVDYVTVEEVHSNWEGEDRWIWIAVNDENRCEDCSDRNEEVKSWDEWEALGLPGMGTTVCSWRCRCSLEPAELAEDVSLPTP
jgi:hypothetical protein